MSLITKYKYLKIEELTLNEDIKYITFNIKSKEIKPYKYKPNNIDNENIYIIYDREQFLQNTKSKSSITQSIKNSSFSCSQSVKDYFISEVVRTPMIDFLEQTKRIKEIDVRMNNLTQSKKFYNNILKRLKFLHLELFEKSDKERKDNLKKGIEKRDKNNLHNKKYSGIIEKIKENENNFEMNF